MSRFIDRSLTIRAELGPCECPGSPHAQGDWASVRARLSGLEMQAWSDATEESVARLTAALVTSWSLLDSEGRPIPVTEDAVASLDAVAIAPITGAIIAAMRASVPVPNPSGAPSGSGTPESASQSLPQES